jgi:hypothetical protein
MSSYFKQSTTEPGNGLRYANYVCDNTCAPKFGKSCGVQNGFILCGCGKYKHFISCIAT